MQIPLKITFRNMDRSDAVEAKIRERAEKLDRFADNIMSCRVVIEAPRKHKNKGGLFHVSIDITLPGEEIVVSRDPGKNHAHEDAYVAIRDAFDAARRQLEDFVATRRGQVKKHSTLPHGKITELVPAEEYGRIETSDGRSIYFHRNSVLGEDFDKLEEGMPVHFNEEEGESGPQASTVHVEGKRHTVG